MTAVLIGIGVAWAAIALPAAALIGYLIHNARVISEQVERAVAADTGSLADEVEAYLAEVTS